MVLAELAEIPFINQLKKMCRSCYIVGGVVRDILAGREFSREVDIAVDDLDSCLAKLSQKTHVIKLSDKFGTVRVFIDGLSFDLTSMTGATIEEDLKNRDFTINSIAFDVKSKQLYDPFSGKKDLESKLLRSVTPNSIKADPVRILRAVRFGPGSGFIVAQELLEQIDECVDELRYTKQERIGLEFFKVLGSDYQASCFEFMDEHKILDVIVPKWSQCRGFVQNEFHVEDVAQHTLTVIRNAETLLKEGGFNKLERQTVICACFFHDICKPDSLIIDKSNRRRFFNHESLAARYARDVLKRFSLERQFVENVVTLVRLHMRPIQCGPSGARRILRDTGTLFKLWRLIKIADKPPIQPFQEFSDELSAFDRLVESIQQIHTPTYSFNGETLKEVGFVEGPRLGACLNCLRRKVQEAPELDNTDFIKTVASRFRKI